MENKVSVNFFVASWYLTRKGIFLQKDSVRNPELTNSIDKIQTDKELVHIRHVK
jgi:hypothetical protein